MNYSRITLFFVFILLFQLSYGQEASTSGDKPQPKFIKYLDGRIENGAMLSNSSELGDQLVNASYYNGLDFRLGFSRTDTNEVLSTVYRRPIIGLGIYGSTFHNGDVGNPNALYFFITIPFAFEQAKRLTFSYSAAFGLAYDFNPYNPVDNPANVFLGSERNCYVHLGFLANYRVAPRLYLNGTIGFKHFSNGSFKQPNAGINLIPLTLGVSYRLNKEEIHRYKTPIPDFIKHGLLNIRFAAGSKNYEVGGTNHLKTTLGITYLRHFNYKYKAGLGLDIFYSADANLRFDSNSDKSDFDKYMSFALFGAWEWSLTKRLYAPVGIGIYLKRSKENGEVKPYYFRAGIAHRFKNNMFAGVTIKAHGGVADYFEWTVGYTIQNDPNKY